MPTRTPFHLVPDHLSGDTILALRELLAQAEAGKILGIAFVAIYKRREYITHACGEALRNPTFARGTVAALDDMLSRLVHE